MANGMNGESSSNNFTGDGPGNGPVDGENSSHEMDQEALNADIIGEEYAALESTLEQIDSCLDDLEGKNDSLNAKLRSLLESTKEAAAMTTDQPQGSSDKDDSDIQKGAGNTH